MGFWAFIKAVVNFAVVVMAGFEVADNIERNEAEIELKKEFQSLKNEFKTIKFDGPDDVKIILIVILVVVGFMLLVWLFSALKDCMGKFVKKSVNA